MVRKRNFTTSHSRRSCGDKKVVFTYGGDSVDMIITYNSASMTFDAGAGDWIAGETAYLTINDPDMNKYPTVVRNTINR